MGVYGIFIEYLNTFMCLGFIKNITLTSIHKLHQRSLPLDPAGKLLNSFCNRTGVSQTVCLYINRSSRRGDSVPCSLKYSTYVDLVKYWVPFKSLATSE